MKIMPNRLDRGCYQYQEEFEKKGNKSAINKIDKMLKAFDEFSLKEIPAAAVVLRLKRLLTNIEAQLIKSIALEHFRHRSFSNFIANSFRLLQRTVLLRISPPLM